MTQPSWSVYSLRGSLGSTQLASTTAMPRPPLWISSGAEPSVVAGVPSWWYAQQGGRGWGRPGGGEMGVGVGEVGEGGGEGGGEMGAGVGSRYTVN